MVHAYSAEKRSHFRATSDAYLIFWACTCPRWDETAGTRRPSHIPKGSPWRKTVLVGGVCVGRRAPRVVIFQANGPN